MKIAKILIAILIMAVTAAAALAYPVDIRLNSNVPFTIATYYCYDDPNCGIQTPYDSNAGTSTLTYTIDGFTDGQIYFAEYQYAACMVPAVSIFTVSQVDSGVKETNLTFAKEPNCDARINFVTTLADAAVNDSVIVSANIDSVMLLHPQSPVIPAGFLQDIFATNTTVSLYDNGVFYASYSARIPYSGNIDVNFTYSSSVPGNHLLEARTDVYDCTCIASTQRTDSTSINLHADHIFMQPIGNYTIFENDTLEFLANATDIYNHQLTYSATTLPSGASFNDFGQGFAVFNWTPAIGQKGAYYITFTARDASIYGNFARETVLITVLDASLKNADDLILDNITIPSTIVEGDIVPFTADITNIGPAQNSVVNFYLDGSMIDSVPFVIALNSTASVATSWTAINGTHTLFVSVDPFNMIVETNEVNNNGTILFNVPMNITNATNITVCTDADLGLNYFVAASTTNTAGSAFADYCLDSVNVVEGYCDANGNVQTQTFACQYGCQNGACNIANNTIPNVTSCTDSDAGLNYYTSATTINTTTIFADYCLDSNTLVEGYCDVNGGVQTQNYVCPDGCVNNACKNPLIVNVGNKQESTNDFSAISVKKLRIYSVENKGYLEDMAGKNQALYADVYIENIGTIDKVDVLVSFSIPDLGIERKEIIKSLKAGTGVSKKLEIQAPNEFGLFEAKLTVSAQGVKTSKYRVIEVLE